MHDNLRQAEHLYMVLAALVIGVLGGMCAIGFRWLIRLFQMGAWVSPTYTLDYIRELPWWWTVSIPAMGGLIVGALVYYLAREAKGHGVPEVMEAVALHSGRIRPRVVLVKMFASAICIATGGSVGREGPIVQIGSTIGSAAGQWLKVGERRLRTLVGCGAAAGIAATFNAPVAGALFAVEIILCDFGVSKFSPIVISSVMATVVSRHFLGNLPAFEVPAYSMVTAYELIAYVILGILAGLAALAFMKVLYAFEDLFDRIRLYPPLKTAFGGVLIGSIALKYPHIFGVGYEAINEALRGDMVWHLLLVLVVVKILAVSITIGSGGSGGIFAPSLFIGAMVGGVVGTVIDTIWPGATGGAGAYALVGMCAVVAAGTHAPITAIVIIFELTNDYNIILPLMISSIIATLLTTSLEKSSIYTLKLLRRGVDIHGGSPLNVLSAVEVRNVMRDAAVAIPPSSDLMTILSAFVAHPGSTVFVVDGRKRLLGLITINEIRPIMTNIEALQGLVTAQNIMVDRDYPVFSPDDSLAEVMRELGKSRNVAPVIEHDKLVGGVWPEDVVSRYNAEIFKRDMATGLAQSISRTPMVTHVPGVKNMALAEISLSPRFDGKTLADLSIRKQFNVTVLFIKQKCDKKEEISSFVPVADTVLRSGDVILALGLEKDLFKFEKAAS